MWWKLEFKGSVRNVMSSFDRIGILGAGRAGTAIARAAARHGIGVQIASTRTPSQMRYHLMQYAPKAEAVAAEGIRSGVDIVLLAVPQEDLDEVDPEWLADRIVVDVTNRWENEPLPDWFESGLNAWLSSSEVIAHRFEAATIVKALNHISHWAMDASTSLDERAAAIASDDPAAAQTIADLVAALGFTPVVVDSLAAGRHMEPGTQYFNVAATSPQLRHYFAQSNER